GRIPGDHGLALVGDPDPLQLGSLEARVDDGLDRDPPGDGPDLTGVVLDPAGTRKVLLELAVGATGDPALSVEDEAGRAGCSLVDGEDHCAGNLPARPPGAGEVAQLACTVDEAAQVPGGGPVGAVQLGFRAGVPGRHR